MACVLVIEDDADIRAALRLLLEDAGYTVGEAVDALHGRDALFSSTSPLVVLVDHKLPVMEGCDLLEVVRQDQDLQRHAYILMTAASPVEVQRECEDVLHICCAVVHKPFDIDAVLSAVEEAEHTLTSQAGR